jgi:iron(III) transport system ATP-binding protein
VTEEVLLEVVDLECRYGQQVVVDDLSFRVRRGNLVCLLGPSGCGKTTVLRAIAGLEPVYRGTISLRGAIVSDCRQRLTPEARRIGMVFQEYALFPHLHVLDNITFGLHRETRRARRQRGLELLDLIGLQDTAQRYPHELSGGQQQRVALARALASKPDVVLLDEPFSSLDIELRERLSHEVHDVLKERGVTGVMVTHDQSEAFAMGEMVGVMRDGRLLQWDTPYNLYHDPANRFIADFIGQGRFVKATLLEPDLLKTEIGTIRAERAFLWKPGTLLELLIRPDDILPDETANLRALVSQKAFKGAETLYTLRCESGVELLSLFPSHLDYAIGDEVGIRVAADHTVAFEAR